MKCEMLDRLRWPRTSGTTSNDFYFLPFKGKFHPIDFVLRAMFRQTKNRKRKDKKRNKE